MRLLTPPAGGPRKEGLRMNNPARRMTLDAVKRFGRKFKGLTFRHIFLKPGGKQYIDWLIKEGIIILSSEDYITGATQNKNLSGQKLFDMLYDHRYAQLKTREERAELAHEYKLQSKICRQEKYSSDTVSYIYFIIDERDRVKIGKSNDPEMRVKDLQVGNADKLSILYTIRTTSKLESILHTEHSEEKIRGEWFDLEKVLPTMKSLGYTV